MNAIMSIYIPHVEPHFSAEYVADCLDKNGIAKVSRIAMESSNNYKKTWIDIKFWHDTEAAFNFIQRLRNPLVEARFVHSDDDWWLVEVNKFPHKTDSSRAKSQLTIFREPDYEYCFDENETTDCVIDILDQDAEDFDEYAREIEFWRNNPDCHPLVRQNSIDNECNAELKKYIDKGLNFNWNKFIVPLDNYIV